MDQRELIEAISHLAREKGIERAEVADIIESVFDSVIKKKYGEADNFDIIVNTNKGEVEIYQEMEVVEDEELDDDVNQICLTDARLLPDMESVEVGDVVVRVIDPNIFGRRAVTSAKQVLNQKIREIERNQIFEEYKNRIGEIVVGTIHQIRRNDAIYVNIEKTELKMPRGEQIEVERYRRGDNIKAIIKDVHISPKGPEIIISRSDDSFLRRLFELEVPEIFDGIVEIKAVARVAGKRSKIIVESNDRRIDAVGACVGLKGSRIKTIVNELGGENVDIINFSKESEVLISRALSPAKPLFIEIDEDRRLALAVFDDSDIATAIGTGGININLTSTVTGYEIDAIRRSEYNRLEGDDIFIEDIEEISPKYIKALHNAGIETVAEFLNADPEQILNIKGIGEKTFERIEEIIQDALDHRRNEETELDIDEQNDDFEDEE